MEKEKYKKLTDKIVPKEDKLKNSIIAFLTGGFIGFFRTNNSNYFREKI